MSKYNRVEHLKNLNAQRRTETHNKVDIAIKRLIKLQLPINFNSVANESGITKATLYNNIDIKERIKELREQQLQVPTPAQVKREMNNNNKDAIIASLKRKIKKLEEENTELKQQIKKSYRDIYNDL